MIRGSQSITALFPTAELSQTSSKKGVFTLYRNECLIHRFYYYYHIQQRRFDVTLADMEREFFVSNTTIVQCISNNGDLLKDILSRDISIKDLRRKYPHLNWN